MREQWQEIDIANQKVVYRDQDMIEEARRNRERVERNKRFGLFPDARPLGGKITHIDYAAAKRNYEKAQRGQI